MNNPIVSFRIVEVSPNHFDVQYQKRSWFGWGELKWYSYMAGNEWGYHILIEDAEDHLARVKNQNEHKVKVVREEKVIHADRASKLERL